MSNVGIYVGTSPEAVKEVSASILEILNAHADQETIRVALNILSKATAAPMANISNCSIDMNNRQQEEQETDE